jgi:hypothetical protein
MWTSTLTVLALEGGLFSLHRIVTSLPTDPASLFTLLLLVIAFGWVVWFGRSGEDDESKPA